MKAFEYFVALLIFIFFMGLLATEFHEHNTELKIAEVEARKPVIHCFTKTIKEGHGIWHRTKCPVKEQPPATNLEYKF